MEISEIAAAKASIGDNTDLREAIAAHIDQDLSTAEVYYRRILRRSPDSSFVKYVLAHLLYDRREHLDESLQLLRTITASEPDNLSFRLLHGKVCAELGQWDEAIVSFRTVNENSPRVPDAYTYLRRPMVVSGRTLELVRILDDVQRRFPDIEVGRLSGFIPEQRAAIAREIPGILLITMPKSGSVYTAMRLSEVLDAPQCRISLDLIPIDHVIPSWAESFAIGGAVCQEHLDASPENLQILATSGVKKLQIHLRDPRQATLSWIHHVETMIGENSYMRDLLSPTLPNGYDEYPFSRKIDWHIDNHLPALVKWTSDWVVASSRNQRGIAMRISSYEDFHRDQTAFFANLLEFFGVSGVEITALSGDNLERNGLHFRLGEVDEWRRVFSAGQCARATEAIPEELRARLDWPR